jgi:hypothetical protein
MFRDVSISSGYFESKGRTRIGNEKIVLHPAHLGGTGKVAFEVLVYEDGGVTGAGGHFGISPFRCRGNHVPELLDHGIIRPDRPETAAGTTQVGNQAVCAQNSSEIVRTYRGRSNPSSDSKPVRDRQR